MAFVATDLGCATLYNPETAPDTEVLWATQLANNISTHFGKGLAVPMPVGSYLYTHISLITTPAGLIADLVALYTDTNKTAEEWGNALGAIIAGWWGTVIFIGTKQMLSTPFTVEPWSGAVSSSFAEPVLIATLTPLYIPEIAPSDWSAFASAVQSAIDSAAKLCYLEIPVILLL